MVCGIHVWKPFSDEYGNYNVYMWNCFFLVDGWLMFDGLRPWGCASWRRVRPDSCLVSCRAWCRVLYVRACGVWVRMVLMWAAVVLWLLQARQQCFVVPASMCPLFTRATARSNFFFDPVAVLAHRQAPWPLPQGAEAHQVLRVGFCRLVCN